MQCHLNLEQPMLQQLMRFCEIRTIPSFALSLGMMVCQFFFMCLFWKTDRMP